MLVYSTTLWLDCQFDDVTDEIAEWLSRKLKEPIHKFKLNMDGFSFVKEGQRIQTVRWDQEWPQLESLTYTHPDTDVKARRWKTEIGIRKNNEASDVEATIILSTEEIIGVDPLKDQTRPIIVQNLLKRCHPTVKTPGTAIIELSEHNSPEFLKRIESTSRRHPIVVVSPTVAKIYPVDPQNILFYVGGISDVVKIVPEANTYEIEEILGERYAAWRGAINLIFPPVRTGGGIRVPTFRYYLEDLELMLGSLEATPEIDILSSISRRVSLPNSWQHISADYVNDQKRRFELMQWKKAASNSGELQQYVQLLEEENKQLTSEKDNLDREISEINEQLRSRDADVEDLNDELRNKEKIAQGWQTSLHYSLAQATDLNVSSEARAAFIQVVNQQPSLEESLFLLETFFPDRLVVLDTAKASARDSRKFESKIAAFRLLFDLVTQYWEALHDGKGDKEAGAIFGNAFALNEGDLPKEAIQRRTFTYKGKEVVMLKHLKIGVKPSETETLRVHFHWDYEDQKIVIGHCGKHLDRK